MNPLDRLSHTAGSADVPRANATVDSPDGDSAIGLLDDVTRDLRALTATLVGREAAISAGHRELARIVVTRSNPIA
jgi:hypothetical protein